MKATPVTLVEIPATTQKSSWFGWLFSWFGRNDVLTVPISLPVSMTPAIDHAPQSTQPAADVMPPETPLVSTVSATPEKSEPAPALPRKSHRKNKTQILTLGDQSMFHKQYHHQQSHPIPEKPQHASKTKLPGKHRSNYGFR